MAIFKEIRNDDTISIRVRGWGGMQDSPCHILNQPPVSAARMKSILC